jgi:hypothetical protein
MNTNEWTFHHNHISSICIAIHVIVKFHEYTLTYNFLVIRNAPCNYATIHCVVNPWQEKMIQKCWNLLYLQSMFLFSSSCLSSCHLTSNTSSKATSVVCIPICTIAYLRSKWSSWAKCPGCKVLGRDPWRHKPFGQQIYLHVKLLAGSKRKVRWNQD